MAHTIAHTSLELISSLPAASARKPLVLVIDPDESTRSVLEVALTRDGFEVWSAAAAPAGMSLLQGRLPDVIVLETDLGGQDGFTFVAQLRGDDRLASIPVLLLAKADDQNVEAMADVVGVDDFLQKPAFARDVAAMVRVEIARRDQGAKAPLKFESKVLPPIQLLRALMSCPRSGRLLLVGGRAEIRFRAGKIIDARFDNRGGTIDTVVRALALTHGTYELVLEPVDGFAELQCSLRELIELVLPRLQKWARVMQRSLPLESRLTVDFSRLAQGLKAMPDEVNRIVQLFDGFRNVEQALIDSSFNETLTLEVATRLYLMGVLAPARGVDEELIVLRPMPRLFEPRASEAEELMQQLFAGTAEIRADDGANAEDADWYSPSAHDTGLEVSDPNGGWTTAPVPEVLAQGLSPELARQLDAFQTPMRVEAAPVAPDVVEAQKFADRPAEVVVDTVMEAALMRAVHEDSVVEIEQQINASLARDEDEALAEAHRAQARGKQARIETPWMTPVVDLPVPAPQANPVEVSASALEPSMVERSVTPVLTPAIAAVGSEAQLRIPTPVLNVAVAPVAHSTAPSAVAQSVAPAVVAQSVVAQSVAPALVAQSVAPAVVAQSAVAQSAVAQSAVAQSAVAQSAVAQSAVAQSAADPEAAFFAADEAASSEEAPSMPGRPTRRVWPFIVGALFIGAVALVIEMMSGAPQPQPTPVVEAPKPVAVVVAPVLPDIEPPEFMEVDEPAPAVVDVSENLNEARKLYEAGQYKKSISVLDQVLTDDPKSITAWNLMGLAKYDSRDVAGARAAADKVLELDPKNGRVQILIATMHFDANEKDLGRAALQKYLELEPNGAEVEEVKALLNGR
jgi:CheY-like chemotaxis protein